jgi:ribosome biogenesis GTPase A
LTSARALVGEKPAILLVNKQDLAESWEVQQEHLELARKRCGVVLATSAKSGANVERAFQNIADLVR